jgi:ATP-dependent exoDNAse (exonuclease V) alpha subunit
VLRAVGFNVKENPHLDYVYAVTSHSSQGQTADRVLIHVDTERTGEKLVNRRLAYVAVSRGRYDAQLYTNDKINLSETLSRDVSHQSATEPTRVAGPAVTQQIGPSSSLSQATQQTIEKGLAMSR